jgi:hypothetical protein
MAAINFPFAASGSRRVPTSDELANGYACGPLDKELDDFMRWWLSGQIDGVIEGAGLTTDDADLEQLLKAIRLLGRIDPTASTAKAPKLIGLTAGGSGTAVPSATNTLLALSLVQNNLSGTSSFASNTLTIGAGEAGIWVFTGFIQWNSGGALNFTSASLKKNGAQVAIGGENAGGGLTSYNTFSEPIKCNVGDTFQFFGYHQAAGTVGTASQSASAFLISAY